MPDREPAWAPDGQRLVFLGRLGGVTDLFVAGVDGSALRRLTFGAGAEREPVWSTEGEIAFQRGQGVWSVQADGTDRNRVYKWLQSPGSRPARRYAPRDIDWGPRRP